VQYVLGSTDIIKKCGFIKKCALSPDVLSQPRLMARSCLLRTAPTCLPPRVFAGARCGCGAAACHACAPACLSL